MKAPPFAYVRATSLADVFRLLGEHGAEAKLLAGGQSLLAALAFRLSEPKTLIDISRVPELQGVERSGTAIRVGALTTHADLGRHELMRSHVPLVCDAVPLIAHPAIRNRGTLGGSLAYADPAAELPAVAVALGAEVVVAHAQGERRIAAEQFFHGLYATALGDDEIIKAVEFPIQRAGERSVILEIARRSGDYAMAGIVLRSVIGGSVLIDPRVVFFGVGDAPVLAASVSAALAGKPIGDVAIATAKAKLADDLSPNEDQHGGPEMKLHLAGVLLTRALRQLSDRAGARAA